MTTPSSDTISTPKATVPDSQTSAGTISVPTEGSVSPSSCAATMDTSSRRCSPTAEKACPPTLSVESAASPCARPTGEKSSAPSGPSSSASGSARSRSQCTVCGESFVKKHPKQTRHKRCISGKRREAFIAFKANRPPPRDRKGVFGRVCRICKKTDAEVYWGRSPQLCARHERWRQRTKCQQCDNPKHKHLRCVSCAPSSSPAYIRVVLVDATNEREHILFMPPGKLARLLNEGNDLRLFVSTSTYLRY